MAWVEPTRKILARGFGKTNNPFLCELPTIDHAHNYLIFIQNLKIKRNRRKYGRFPYLRRLSEHAVI